MALVDSIIGAESGGDPNARNPSSSASGVGQFIDSTWLDTLRGARPDLAQGKSDADLLALKTDPQLSREITEAYAAQNAAILAKAGQPVTPGTTYLAHFAGPQGAVSVLSADPSTPVSQVLTPAAVKANSFLQGMTAGDLRAWADRKMGGASPPPPASQAAAPAVPINHLPPQTPPIFAQQPQPQQAQEPAEPLQSSAAAETFQPAPTLPLPPAPTRPFFAAPRKQIDLSKLRAALAGNKTPIFAGRSGA
jgi:hypothetical protein